MLSGEQVGSGVKGMRGEVVAYGFFDDQRGDEKPEADAAGEFLIEFSGQDSLENGAFASASRSEGFDVGTGVFKIRFDTGLRFDRGIESDG